MSYGKGILRHIFKGIKGFPKSSGFCLESDFVYNTLVAKLKA